MKVLFSVPKFVLALRVMPYGIIYASKVNVRKRGTATFVALSTALLTSR
jgi:hypothetical protein